MITPHDPVCGHCHRPRSEHDVRDLYPACPEDAAKPDLVHTTFRRRVEDMPRFGVAPHPSVPLGRYRHYTSPGGLGYVVIGGALRADVEGDIVEVLYMDLATGYCGSRTVENFTASWLDGSGDPVHRFVRVPDSEG